MMSLLTYHRLDSGWSHIGYTRHALNAGGKAGAWLADFFLYFFGYTGYLFPLLWMYLGVLAYRGLKIKTHSHLLMLSGMGLILVLCAAMGLSSLYLPKSIHIPYTAGGILGNLMGYRLARYVNQAGATVILAATLLCGLTLLTGISWVRVSHFLGALSTDLLKKGVGLCHQAFHKLKKSQLDSAQEKGERFPFDDSHALTTAVREDNLLPIPSHKPLKKENTALSLPPRLANALVSHEKKEDFTTIKNLPKKEDATPRFLGAEQTGLPTVSLLNQKTVSQEKRFSKEYLDARSREVEQRLAEFSVEVNVVEVHPGPVVTRYEMELAAGVKVSKISNLSKDLARSLSTSSVRVVEVIPGKSLVGIELPNPHREIVLMREVLESPQYQDATSMLSMVLGKDIAGHPIVVDLAKMPHLLVAGTTGSGKSVGLNVMLLSLLFKATPKDVRLIMIDPKMLELSIYEGIPHLLTPVVTDMKQAANALRWCVGEMERRYQLMAALGVRNLAGYNEKIDNGEKKGTPLVNPLIPHSPSGDVITLEKLPHIVVLIDEFADMMMVVGKKVEELIARIAQKARAAGIHLILATQRPSVDVITGLIKANIPTRIAFQVSSKIDSRTILDQQGAEQLLGHGDMLYLPPGSGVPIRVHGAFVADEEVHTVVAELKKLGLPNYLPEITESRQEPGEAGEQFEEAEGEQDPLYDEAVDFVIQNKRVSISSLQRRFKIGYNRSARIVEDMEKAGVVTNADHGGTREVIAQPIQMSE